MSHPSRDVWIEIIWSAYHWSAWSVTSLTGCVDWNLSTINDHQHDDVTSLTGCVDWNRSADRKQGEEPGHIPHGMCGLKYTVHKQRCVIIIVTSLTGCVDWNANGLCYKHRLYSHIPHGMCGLKCVSPGTADWLHRSHPSRDVWIEIRFFAQIRR